MWRKFWKSFCKEGRAPLHGCFCNLYVWIWWISSFLSVDRRNYYILLAGTEKLVVLRVFVKLHLLKRLLRKKIRWFADVSDSEKGDTPIKQDRSSRKRKHDLNSKEDDSADEFIDRKKKSRWKQLTKKSLNKAFSPDQRRIIQVWFDYSMINCFWNYSIYIMPYMWKHCLCLIEFSRHTQSFVST